MSTLKLDIRHRDVIDWYDGVLSALVELGEDSAPHLLLVLAWSPEYEVWVHGLIPVAADTSAAIRGLLAQSPTEESWSAISGLVNEAARKYSGSVAVLAMDPIGKAVIGRAELPAAQVPELRSQEDRMEDAYDELLLFAWLERLGVPKPLSWQEKEQRERDSEDR